ncbi:hypothetical protein [Nitratireductor sp. StC3]|uniref:hypothetical protein n=1 Tax=Nitratireductor sp. StC3 TaxID=2126741 RepID=UPI000D0DEE90|nr:hypothetical protein [Nitratireductor sp. StC3]PSM17638.1 hypothetical protein C7T96_15065 [Nitratireductor sp. StC3]
MPITVGLIRASLPSYFPDRHGVFTDAVAMLEPFVDALGARLVVAPEIPMDGCAAQAAVDHCLAEGAEFLLLLHGGFTMGDVARQIAVAGVPMGVWATPEPGHEGDIQLNNFVSLNMSMSIARGVRDLARAPVQWYFGAPGDPALQSRLGQTIRALAARAALRTARIGVVGGLAPTFYNMDVSSNALKAGLGVDVDHIDIHRMTAGMAAASDDTVAEEVARMAAAADIRGVSDKQMTLTARAALALRAIAREGDYDALAVSDWPALQEEPGMHPGAAFSWLEEVDNLPVASEGDVLGAVTQIAVSAVTGRVGCLLDMTSPDLDADRILMWHGGGGPLYMAKQRPAWINHPMIGRGTEAGPCFGAIADYEFAEGPMTILRVARDGQAVFALEAAVHKAPESGFTGCRGWVGAFTAPASGSGLTARDVVTTVMEHGLEHHFVLVPGHWARTFEEFAAWSALERLGPIRAHDGLPH